MVQLSVTLQLALGPRNHTSFRETWVLVETLMCSSPLPTSIVMSAP